MQETMLGAERVSERGALGAEPAGIGGMIRIASQADAVLPRFREHATSDTAVRTRRAYSGRHGPFAMFGPNNSSSRMAVTSRPAAIISKYHGPALASPYNTAPQSLLSRMTSRL